MDFTSDPQNVWPALLLFHFILSGALWKMAQRTKEEPAWYAFVPILNLILMLRIGRKPLWWVILFFVPFVNIVFGVMATMACCERFGVNKWAGLLALVSPLNLVLFYYLAYGTKAVVDTPVKPATPKVDAPPPSAPVVS